MRYVHSMCRPQAANPPPENTKCPVLQLGLYMHRDLRNNIGASFRFSVKIRLMCKTCERIPRCFSDHAIRTARLNMIRSIHCGPCAKERRFSRIHDVADEARPSCILPTRPFTFRTSVRKGLTASSVPCGENLPFTSYSALTHYHTIGTFQIQSFSFC